MPSLYDKHIQQMREINFLHPDENEQDFRSDLHYTKLWADTFWRRREHHKTRIDPEISHLGPLKPQKVLEIGSGYGRVTSKIVNALPSDVIVEGVEVCKHFESYFSEYRETHVELNRVKIFYDNFFKTNMLEKDNYDLIILPMNTMPGFPIQALEPLFNIVASHLKIDGVFLFSTYKVPEIISEEFIDRLDVNNYSSEILTQPKTDMIISEFFSPKTITKEYGVKNMTYISNNRIDREYKLIERGVFLSQREFIRPKYLEEIIVNKGFEIVIKDDSSHSFVYGLRKLAAD